MEPTTNIASSGMAGIHGPIPDYPAVGADASVSLAVRAVTDLCRRYREGGCSAMPRGYRVMFPRISRADVPAFIGELEHLADELREAYTRGVGAAVSAATWAPVGADASRVLAMMDRGEDVYDYLPEWPNLSGEWADSETPRSLAADIMGADYETHGYNAPDFLASDAVSALADAWHAGVSATFSSACEAELVGALPDPSEMASLLLDVNDLDDALSAASRFNVAEVERGMVARAIYAEHLRRIGVTVDIGYSVGITADGPALYYWARGRIDGLPNAGAIWPCSTLAHDVDGLSVALDGRTGDLIDLELIGLVYRNADGCYYRPGELDSEGDPLPQLDGMESAPLELSGDELSAFLSDILAVSLPVDHPAWWGAVGQFLPPDDPRVIVANQLSASTGA